MEKEMKVSNKELDKWEDFKEVVKPVMDWLKKNYHPHMKMIIDSISAELVSGEMVFYDREIDNEEEN